MIPDEVRSKFKHQAVKEMDKWPVTPDGEPFDATMRVNKYDSFICGAEYGYSLAQETIAAKDKVIAEFEAKEKTNAEGELFCKKLELLTWSDCKHKIESLTDQVKLLEEACKSVQEYCDFGHFELFEKKLSELERMRNEASNSKSAKSQD